MAQLEFKVNSQTLKRLDSFKPAAGSVDYLTASFAFSEDWSGTAKTAKCRKDNAIYSAAINSSGVCFIPHEVLAQDETKRAFGAQEFYISVEGVNGTQTITTEEIKIELMLTGSGEAVNAAAPTESLYAQYVAAVTENYENLTKEIEDIKTNVENVNSNYVDLSESLNFLETPISLKNESGTVQVSHEDVMRIVICIDTGIMPKVMLEYGADKFVLNLFGTFKNIYLFAGSAMIDNDKLINITLSIDANTGSGVVTMGALTLK